MYFFKQQKHLFIGLFTLYNVDAPVGDGPEEQAAAAETVARKPEEETRAELADWVAGLSSRFDSKWTAFVEQGQRIDAGNKETTEEARARISAERTKSAWEARTDSAEAISGKWGSPESILTVTPASPSERYAAMAALQGAWVEVTDETLAKAIVEGRWDNPWEIRELTPEEQIEANKQLLSSAGAEVDIEPEVLQGLYDFAHEGSDMSEMKPEDLIEFADQMERLRILTERNEGIEIPATKEEFDALMERFTGDDGKLHIPLTREEAEAQGFVFNEDWTINFDESPTYAPTWDSPAGQPYVRNGQVMSWYRWGARNVPGWPASRLSDAELAELPGGVEWLLEFISHAEGTADNYNAQYGNGSQNAIDFTSMTLQQVREHQRQMVRENGESSAMWKYQIMWYTLDDYVASNNISWDTKFDETFQDNFAKRKLVTRGLNNYLAGGSIDAFQASIAQEWASIPKDSSWLSHYAHDGINGATVSHQQIQTQLRRLREA